MQVVFGPEDIGSCIGAIRVEMFSLIRGPVSERTLSMTVSGQRVDYAIATDHGVDLAFRHQFRQPTKLG